MNNIDAYQILEQISDGLKTTVYRAIDKNKKPVILKVLREEYADSEKIARFRREYELTSSLNSKWIIKAYDLIKYNNSLIMVLEDFGGISLKDFLMKNAPVTDKEQLKTALTIAKLCIQAIADIHKNNIIHKDINSTNIVYNPKNHQLKIIDFGLATELSFERLNKHNLQIEGTFAYISPEQTGRIDRDIDYRTDYYSLGITFYELLSGTLPFQANNSREWIHCHIAKKPNNLSDFYTIIPKMVSTIVLKMMEKTAESRYQSSFGLIKDIEFCLESIEKNDIAEDYHIGQYDISQKFQVPQKLYGRKNEILKLLHCFENVSKGQPACFLIKGYSGIGKTSLAGEIKRSIIEKNGNFISGKFDQFKGNIPYSALILAFTNLIQTLTTESQEEIENWKDKILRAIPNNAKLIIDLIPELELIIGKQPTPPDISAFEAQNRFDITFQKFFQLFAEIDHPLVIFLDDLHWADSSSLDMIYKILNSSESKPVLFLGAYRDQRVSEEHPLLHTIDSINNSGIITIEIELGPINESNVSQLLTETFACKGSDTEQLSKLCFEKSQGNPFFLIEFISNLCRNNYINFNSDEGKWNWDIDQIKKTEVTENVAGLISKRILDLPGESQEILKLASCFGSQFELNSLSIVSGKSCKQILTELKIPLKESLIMPLEVNYLYAEYTDNLDVSYRFIHDRVHSATYALLNDEEKLNTHLKIGRLLLEKSSEKQIDDDLFIIIGHLNKGISLLRPEEKNLLAEYNLKACKKAKSSGAFVPAYHYASLGLKLIPDNSWTENYQLTFDLYTEAAETASLNGNHAKMEKLLQNCYIKTSKILDKAKIHEIRTQSLIAQNEQKKAIKETLYLLKILGIEFPSNAGKHHVIINLFKTKSLLARVKTENIAVLPQMEDRIIIAAMRNMANIISVLYRTDPNLFTLVVCKLIKLSIKYGVAPISPVSFITFGLLVNAIFSDIAKACELGKLGMDLFKRLDAKNHWAQAFYMYNVAITFWEEPLTTTNDNLLKAYKAAQETGDFEYMMSAAAARAHYLFRAGSELKELIQSTEKYKKSISLVYKEITYSQFDVLIQMFTNFIIPSKKPEELIGINYDERKMIEYHLKDKDDTSLMMIHLDKLTLAYYFERYDQSLAILKNSKKYLKGIIGLLMFVNFNYFESLTLLAKYDSLNSIRRRKIKKKVVSNQKKMKKWADHAPMNFLCKYKLIEAEKERVFGTPSKAEDLYNESISLSLKNGFIHEEALANELAAKNFLSLKNEINAKPYINKAYQLYNIWGAFAKAQILKEKYSELIIIPEPDQHKSFSTQTSSLSQLSLSIDMETILEASKTISSEIILDELLKKALVIILEHAGAQSGTLIIKDKDTNKFVIEAVGKVEKDKIQVSLSHLNITDKVLPTSIINYVERTNQILILQNAQEESNFKTNEYIKSNNVKSLITIPILQQAKLIGILYLENNLSSHVFTQERITVLTILCTQVAVSLENARLYNTLEQKVHERTLEVLKQKEEIQEKANELKSTNEKLTTLNVTKDKLFSIIAHDLKNPFNIILGYSNLLIEDLDKMNLEEIRKSVNSIYNSSNSAYELLQNLLEWSRSQVGRINCSPKYISLKNLVEKNIDLHMNIAKSKNIKLTNHIPGDITVYVDQDMTSTIIRNLISNALKFTPRGGEVNISSSNKNEFAEVIISDNGVGIAEENISKLFRLDVSHSTIGTANEKGTGLGLILCKEFVNQNGGELSAESEPGKGTKFIFTIPLKKQ